MKEIRVEIVDDDVRIHDMIQVMLRDWNESRTEPVNLAVSCYNSGDTLLLDEDCLDYHMVFVDIVMPGARDGIKTAKELRARGYKNELAYISLHDRYAIEAYGNHAMAYLQKGNNLKMLSACMERLLLKMEPHYYMFREKKMIYHIECKNIIYFQSSLHYVEIITETEIYRHKAQQQQQLHHLPGYFAQCHRVNVVNIRHIDKNCHDYVILSNGERLNISHKYRQSFLRALTDESRSRHI